MKFSARMYVYNNLCCIMMYNAKMTHCWRWSSLHISHDKDLIVARLYSYFYCIYIWTSIHDIWCLSYAKFHTHTSRTNSLIRFIIKNNFSLFLWVIYSIIPLSKYQMFTLQMIYLNAHWLLHYLIISIVLQCY